MQPPGVSAAENLIKETKGFAGLDASLENVYCVGSVVMEEVLEHWDRYQTEIPDKSRDGETGIRLVRNVSREHLIDFWFVFSDLLRTQPFDGRG